MRIISHTRQSYVGTLTDFEAGWVLQQNLITDLRNVLTGFGGLVVSILATGTRVLGFKPGIGHPENPQYAFLRRGSKIICPMYQFCGM
jgi:hypothetical protein